MRIDHIAYQRATKVAGVGLLVQIAVGIGLLVFGLLGPDTAFTYAAAYAIPGILVWLGLVILFHQHKLERLEALEEDELAATRNTGGESVFDRDREEARVAARRLAMMHKWFMPGLSVFMVAVLALLAWLLLRHMKAVVDGAADFHQTGQRGWAIAIALAGAVLSFIVSRFVAGMAKQTAWANLRGGAAYMVGNALVLVAVAIGLIFRFFDNDEVIQGIAWAIPCLMIVLTLEISLNFVLNLYRPRIPGEVPRPAFDSKLLSLFAAPDNFVRSLNEAVNYQFGFDVTSSWGYQLLLRSFVSLAVLGVVAMVLLSTMVVIEPHQQALRLRGGAVVRDGNGEERIYGSGVMWKWPWPIESAAVYDVARLRNLWLTAKVVEHRPVDLWSWEMPKTPLPMDSFIVAAPVWEQARGSSASTKPVQAVPASQPTVAEAAEQPTAEDLAAEVVSAQYSLVNAEIVLQYRIRSSGRGLLDYLEFGSDRRERLQQLTDRERALKYLALAVVSSELSRRTIDDVLSPGRSNLSIDLAREVQKAFDRSRTGVEVVALEIPLLRPGGEVTTSQQFEEFGIGKQNRRSYIADEERTLAATHAYWVGDPRLTKAVLEGIDEYNALRAAGSPEAAAKRQEVERMLVRGQGEASQRIAQAESDRWVELLQRRAEATNVQSQLAAYRAAPELFQHRAIMQVYRETLPNIDKFVLGVDPSRVRIDLDLKKVNPVLDFAGASKDELEHAKP